MYIILTCDVHHKRVAKVCNLEQSPIFLYNQSRNSENAVAIPYL